MNLTAGVTTFDRNNEETAQVVDKISGFLYGEADLEADLVEAKSTPHHKAWVQIREFLSKLQASTPLPSRSLCSLKPR